MDVETLVCNDMKSMKTDILNSIVVTIRFGPNSIYADTLFFASLARLITRYNHSLNIRI